MLWIEASSFSGSTIGALPPGHTTAALPIGKVTVFWASSRYTQLSETAATSLDLFHDLILLSLFALFFQTLRHFVCTTLFAFLISFCLGGRKINSWILLGVAAAVSDRWEYRPRCGSRTVLRGGGQRKLPTYRRKTGVLPTILTAGRPHAPPPPWICACIDYMLEVLLCIAIWIEAKTVQVNIYNAFGGCNDEIITICRC